MPSIILNKKEFEDLVGKKLPLEELKDRISMLGTDLEKIEGNEIHVEVFPNRPDMLSEQGFARAFSSFIGVKTGLRKYEVKKSIQKVIVDTAVKDIRPYTACAIIKNLRLNSEKIKEIMQIQEKLHITYGRNRKKAAIGVYPLDRIAFPITYTAKYPHEIKFEPLESSRIMAADEIIAEHRAGKEYGHLLTGLKKYPIFIDSKKQILSMPPIINSNTAGKVTEKTTEVFVECSGFDFQSLSICLNIIVTMFADMNADIYSVDIHYDPEIKITPDLNPKEMDWSLKYVNKRLGLKLDENEAVKLLERMGYGYETVKVLVPAYRADILHQVDVVEDIAIAYGYENFKEEIPNVSTIGEEDKLEKFISKIREILIGLELLEVKNYHLSTEKDLNHKMKKKEKIIPLKNALGEHNHLRNSLLPSLLKNLSENQHHEYPQNIFETGRIFNYGNTETGVKEKQKLSILVCHERADFTEIMQILNALFSSLSLEVKIKESENASFIEGRIGNIVLDGKVIGMIGEIHPEVLENFSLIVPVVGLELEVEAVFERLEL